MPSRRRFVTGSAVVIAGLAGCVRSDDDAENGTDDNGDDDDSENGTENGDENGNENGSVEDLREPSADYTEWVGVDLDDSEWSIGSFQPTAVVPHEDSLDEGIDEFGIDADDVLVGVAASQDELGAGDAVFATVGDFAAETVVEAIDGHETDELTLAETVSGYDIYEGTEEVLAVRDNVAILSLSREPIETGIDLIEGEPSAADRDERLARFEAARTGDDVTVVRSDEDFEGAIVGLGYDLGPEDASASIVVAGERGDAMDDIAAEIIAASEQFTAADGPWEFDDITIDEGEQTITITGTHSSDRFEHDDPTIVAESMVQEVGDLVREALGNFDHVAPQISLDISYDGESLTITHQGGDAVPAGELKFDGEGFEAAGQTWAEITDLDPDDSVMAGEQASLTADADHLVEVVWLMDGEPSAVLAHHEGPDR